MIKPPCKCGHLRSDHLYLYYGKRLRVKSPCKKCGKQHFTWSWRAFFVCNSYKPMDNLDYVEWLAKKRKLV